MKKSLLALAVFGAFAGVASAQTNVTIYGLVDAGLTREKGATDSVWKLATGVQSGNRLGFKGSEDLGGGLKANFQLENGFDLDTGALRQGGRIFGRQAWVGLSGGFGSVSFGRQYDPLFVALDSIDPFGTGLTGATSNLMGSGATGDVRVNNSIAYSTTNMGGFTANALYGLGEVVGNNSLNRTYSVSAAYANGPVAATLAYSNSNLTATNTAKQLLVGGTFNFGVATAHVGFETDKNDAGRNFRDWMVGVSAPVGAGTVLASYINKDDRNVANNAGAKQYALGYTHSLSKRTNLYTSYAHIKNDAASAAVVGDASSGGTAVAAGQSSNAFTVGIRHKF